MRLEVFDGEGLRTGIEDTIWLDEDRAEAATNRALVQRVLTFADVEGRNPHTLTQARAILGCA